MSSLRSKINLKKINYRLLVKSLVFSNYHYMKSSNDFRKIDNFLKIKGASFLHVKTSVGTLKKLLRPKNFIKLKEDFLEKTN